MQLIEHLEIYIQAQNGVGLIAILFGSVFLISALFLHLYGESGVSSGIRNGALVIGILLFAMGIGLHISQENLLKENKALYKYDKVEFQQTEIERMSKVKNNYPRQQIIMVGLVALSLAAFLVINNAVWQGVSLSVAVFMLGNIIIEAFSYLAILAYYKSLTG